MEKIKIGSEEFVIEINRKKIQTIRLKIKERNIIIVSIPWFVPLIVVKKFINNNGEWILEHNQKLAKTKKIDKIKKFEILGEKYEVEIKKTLRNSLVIIDKKIYINYSHKKKIKEIIDKKMRVLASKLIKERTRELAEKHNLSYGNVGIKNQSSRFGSCSGRGSLNFNWQIILFPVDKFEHVILHELTHLTVKNHSKIFWEQLGKYDKNWRENNRWLRKEGTKRFIV